jgi:hypothetical protein
MRLERMKKEEEVRKNEKLRVGNPHSEMLAT